jgi:hypothetical protein
LAGRFAAANVAVALQKKYGAPPTSAVELKKYVLYKDVRVLKNEPPSGKRALARRGIL